MKRVLDKKLYYSISEVAGISDLPAHTLRSWEREFPWLKPRRVSGKNRAYKPKDIGLVLLLKDLLHEQGYTTKGVHQKLRNEPDLVRQAGELFDTAQPDAEASAPAPPVPPAPEPSAPAVAEAPQVVAAEPASRANGFSPDGKSAAELHQLRQRVDEIRAELREILTLLQAEDFEPGEPASAGGFNGRVIGAAGTGGNLA